MSNKDIKQTQGKKSKKWVIPLVGVLSLAVGGGAGWAITTYAIPKKSKTNPEIDKEHEIVISSQQEYGYAVSCDKASAKMGDVVTFTVNKNSNETKVPKAIRLFANNDQGTEVSSDYPLKADGQGAYIATVTITYISNMRTELVFEEASKLVVSFDSTGGSSVESISVEESQYITAPTNPTKDHYTFKYWHLKDSDTPFDFEHTPITQSITLYAKWEADKYTITWKNWDGTVLETDTDVEYGTKPHYDGSTPTRDTTAQYSYKFNGWDKDISLAVADEVYTATYIQTINEYAVTFDTDYGTRVPPVAVKYGTTISEPTTTKEGYTFKGWYNGQTPWNFTTPITAKTTLTAHWEINKFTVSFDTDGGSQAPQDITNVEWDTVIDVSKKPTDPTKSHYVFDGWYANGTKFEFGSTKVKSNIKLVAKWLSESAYTVTFDTQGGSLVSAQTVYKNEKASQPSSPTKTGHTFKGWYDAATGGNVFDFNTPITSNKTIYAQWTAKTCNIVFKESVNQTAGTQLGTATTNYGEAIKASDVPTPEAKTGYVLKGWSKKVNSYDPFDLTQPITNYESSTTIYAYYEAATVVGMQLVNYPTQMVYPVGATASDINLTGLKVNLLYSDKTTSEVTDFSSSDWSKSFEEQTAAEGYNKIVLTYKNSVTLSITVGITNKYIDLTISNYPECTIVKGSTFSPKGLKVDLCNYKGETTTIEWTTDQPTEHSAEGFSISSVDTSTVGQKQVTVTRAQDTTTLKDLNVTFNVNVVNQYKSLVITTNPSTTQYQRGSTFSPKNMKVTLTDYLDQETTTEWTSDDITEHSEYTITGADSTSMSTTGIKTVTVTHNASGLTATFPISVTDAYFTVNFYLNDGSSGSETKIVATQRVKEGDKVAKPLDPTSSLNGCFAGWYKEKECINEYDFTTAATSNPGNAYAKWVDGFNGVAWDKLGLICDYYESITTPTLSDAKAMCAMLGVDATDVTTGTAQECLQTKLVGLQGVITINGQKHTVRCIDAMHDVTSTTSTTTALTFELVTILSNAQGKSVTSKYCEGSNWNYLTSSTGLRKTIQSTVSLLPTELQGVIKEVTKKVGAGQNWPLTNYNDKLFALTSAEMNLSGGPTAGEGTAYKYWQDHTDASDRIKKNINGDKETYRLATASATATQSSVILYDGSFITRDYDIAYGVSFAFCI